MGSDDSVVEQVVHLLNEGWTVQQMAYHLGISEWKMRLLADELEERCFGVLEGVHEHAEMVDS